MNRPVGLGHTIALFKTALTGAVLFSEAPHPPPVSLRTGGASPERGGKRADARAMCVFYRSTDINPFNVGGRIHGPPQPATRPTFFPCVDLAFQSASQAWRGRCIAPHREPVFTREGKEDQPDAENRRGPLIPSKNMHLPECDQNHEIGGSLCQNEPGWAICPGHRTRSALELCRRPSLRTERRAPRVKQDERLLRRQ